MSSDNPYAPPESEVAVSDPVALAGRGVRLGGAIIDAIIAMAVIFPVVFAMGYWEKAMAGEQTVVGNLWLGVLGIGVFLVLNGYLLANHGQTIGKRLVKTRIVSIDDEEILPFWKVISLRYLPLWILSQIPLLGQIFGLVDSLFIFRGDKRCIHDMIAGTKVVTVRTPELISRTP